MNQELTKEQLNGLLKNTINIIADIDKSLKEKPHLPQETVQGLIEGRNAQMVEQQRYETMLAKIEGTYPVKPFERSLNESEVFKN